MLCITVIIMEETLGTTWAVHFFSLGLCFITLWAVPVCWCEQRPVDRYVITDEHEGSLSARAGGCSGLRGGHHQLPHHLAGWWEMALLRGPCHEVTAKPLCSLCVSDRSHSLHKVSACTAGVMTIWNQLMPAPGQKMGRDLLFNLITWETGSRYLSRITVWVLPWEVITVVTSLVHLETWREGFCVCVWKGGGG